MCYNEYPTWPKFISYSSEDPIANVSITTRATEENDDDSAGFYSALLITGLALLF